MTSDPAQILRTCDNAGCFAAEIVRTPDGEVHVRPKDPAAPVGSLCNSCAFAVYAANPTPLPPAPPPPSMSGTPRDPNRIGGRAAVVLATTHRPALLRACLSRLAVQALPHGWTFAVFVAGTNEDFGITVVRAMAPHLDVRWVPAPDELIGHKLREAVHAADRAGADLILWVGDDDLQPNGRLASAIAAYEAGRTNGLIRAGGLRGYWQLDTVTGAITWWEGGGRWYGAGVSMATDPYWRRIGWRPDPKDPTQLQPVATAWGIDRGAEPWLYSTTWLHPSYVQAAPEEVGRGVVCLLHGRNLTSRPALAKGEVLWVGAFEVTGCGNLHDPPDGFPFYPELIDVVTPDLRGAVLHDGGSPC